MASNPNWPTVAWKVYTAANPPTAPNAPGGSPTDISSRVKSMTISRGRQYELAQDEAGTATTVVDNNDGTLTASIPAGRIPMRYATCVATWAATPYPLFTGFVSGWPDKASDPATNDASVSFVDLFEALANVPLQSLSRNALAAFNVPPDHLFPFADNSLSSSAADVMGTNPNPFAQIVAYKGGDPGTLKFGGTSLAFHDASTTLTNDNAAGPAGKASQVQLNGPTVRNAPGAPTIDTTRPWMVHFYLKATAGASSAFSIRDRNGNVFAHISWVASTGIVTYYAGGATITVNASGGYLSGGIQVMLGFDGTNAFYGYNGGVATMAGYGSQGLCSWIAAGASFNGTSIFGGSQSTYWMQYLAMWTTGTLPTMAYGAGGVGLPLSELYYAFTNAYGNNIDSGQLWSDEAFDRLTRVLSWAGQAGLQVDLEPAFLLSAMQDSNGSAVLDLLKQTALDVFGRFYIDQSGLPTFRSKDHGQALVAPQYVFGSNTGAGELPYTGGPGFDFDTQHVYNDVQVSIRGDVTQQAMSRWLNNTSIGKYFQRVLQISSGLAYTVDAISLAQFLAGRYGDPDYRIQDIVLEPSANPALWPCVLGLNLNDVVQVNHKDVNGTRSFLFQVEKIHHDVVGGESWKVTLSLSPFHQYWLLGAMHTTFKAACLLGATSISLNPLPDSATNCAEASIGVGRTITLEPGTGNAETVTITSVTSVPTARTAGYTSITLGVTATAHAHAINAVACDPLPGGVTDPTKWDARSVLGTTTVITFDSSVFGP